VLIARGVEVPAEIIDPLPITNGLNEYRVTAVSATPTYSVTEPIAVQGTDGLNPATDGLWVWLTFVNDFGVSLRVHGDLDIEVESGRTAATQHFLGRPKPVLLLGANTDLVVSASGTLRFDTLCEVLDPDNCLFDSHPHLWTAAGLVAEMVCYRDFTGRRIFGMLSPVNVKDVLWPGHAAVSFVVTQADFVEVYVPPLPPPEPPESVTWDDLVGAWDEIPLTQTWDNYP
jgi:hypothetical protein